FTSNFHSVVPSSPRCIHLLNRSRCVRSGQHPRFALCFSQFHSTRPPCASQDKPYSFFFWARFFGTPVLTRQCLIPLVDCTFNLFVRSASAEVRFKHVPVKHDPFEHTHDPKCPTY